MYRKKDIFQFPLIVVQMTDFSVVYIFINHQTGLR